jgi:molecular chaperone DnaJ
MARTKDYYSILGLSRDATEDQIQSSFRKLAMKYHPDKNPNDNDAVSKFNEINEAYQVLGDKEKKQQYDSPLSPFNFSFFSQGFTTGHTRRGQKGQDIIIALEITLEEVLKGAHKVIKYKRFEKCDKCSGNGGSASDKNTCPKCAGLGRVIEIKNIGLFSINSTSVCDLCSGSGNIFKSSCSDCSGTGRILKDFIVPLNIDAGTTEENDTVMKYYGHVGEYNGVSGNLIVKFKVKEHPYLKRQGHNVFYTVHLTLTQAVLGHKINVKTLDADEEIVIDADKVNLKRIILQNKGLPYFDQKNKKGDQIIELIVDLPTSLTDCQKLLFEGLKKEGL